MILLVNGATKTIQELSPNKYLGILKCPTGGTGLPLTNGIVWGADNNAFAGFDEKKYFKMLDKIRNCAGCKFVTMPDKVADSTETLKLFDKYYLKIREYGLPLAFVLQDGINDSEIPWMNIQAIFIGGSTTFKLSEQVKTFCLKAQKEQKWLHMGRVNSFKRIKIANEFKCHSFDGSSYSMFPKTHIPKTLKFLKELDNDNLFSRTDK